MSRTRRRTRAGLAIAAVLAVGACGDAKPPAPVGREATEPAAPGPSGTPAGTPAGTPGPPPEGTLDPSGLPGSILFVSERDGDLEVYRWRAVAEPARLTDDPRADFVGEVAADGAGWLRVATEDGASPEEHREQLMWMPTGGEPVLVGPAGRRGRGASWAPDRSFLVFESDAEGAFSDLWRWEPGGALRRLTHTEDGAFEPVVSSRGRIAYVSTQDGNPELYVMEGDGRPPRRLTDWRREDMSPRWSPDGRRLAFLRREQGGERLFVLELPEPGEPGSEPGEPGERRLVPTEEGEPLKHADHTWSPDGRALAYTVHRPDRAPQVVVTTIEGGATRVVSPDHLRATMPAWSPDGRFLAFAGTTEDPAALDLYAVALDGGAWARLTRHPAPDWLPRWSPS